MMGSNKVVPIPKKIATKCDFYLHICKTKYYRCDEN